MTTMKTEINGKKVRVIVDRKERKMQIVDETDFWLPYAKAIIIVFLGMLFITLTGQIIILIAELTMPHVTGHLTTFQYELVVSYLIIGLAIIFCMVYYINLKLGKWLKYEWASVPFDRELAKKVFLYREPPDYEL